ncbi:AimR family lysis-lysogeny pheromone receptor [Robertmurraya siralis]|uniref:AimR family lysis-lysogeny pheromone receptor n=1 Tax=Robertmurraya siralis TaxID=77777 RepID=UPI0010F46F0B|nr:AimR family lysis-lysogeny pheromone receptor [Robertmurraya siralis]
MLYQQILNKLDEERGLADQYCTIAGYKNGNALRKSLRENREFGSFQGLVNLVQELFPNDEKQLMAEYAMTLDPNKQTARYMLEYCELNKLTYAKEKLLNDMLKCSNSQSKEWASVYYIEHRFSKGEINLDDAMQKYGKLAVKQPETIVAKEIYKAYCYSTSQIFNMVYPVLIGVENYFSEIREEYIKNSLIGRHRLLISEHYIMINEIEKAREYCLKLINEIECKHLKSVAYLQLGNSYIISNFDMSYDYLKKALNLIENYNINVITNIKRSLSFLHNVWNKTNSYLDCSSEHPSDVHEVAFSLFNNGEKGKAISILNQLDFSKLSDNQKAFHLYILGKIRGDLNAFTNSIIYFKKSGDVMFRQLPIIELKKFNIPESVLRAMTF